MPSPVQSPRANAYPANIYAAPAPVGADDDAMRIVMQGINMDEHTGNISAPELQRAYAMAAHHGIAPDRLKAVYLDLSIPKTNHNVERTWNQERRHGLACMLGMRIGFDTGSAQKLVDDARNKNVGEIVAFVSKEIACAGIAAGSIYGAYLVAGKAASGIGAKAGLIKAGGLGIKGFMAAGTGVAGWALLGYGAIVGAVNIVRGVADKSADIMVEHRDVLEATWAKDVRILEGIKQGRITLPNHAPLPRRAA